MPCPTRATPPPQSPKQTATQCSPARRTKPGNLARLWFLGPVFFVSQGAVAAAVADAGALARPGAAGTTTARSSPPPDPAAVPDGDKGRRGDGVRRRRRRHSFDGAAAAVGRTTTRGPGSLTGGSGSGSGCRAATTVEQRERSRSCSSSSPSGSALVTARPGDNDAGGRGGGGEGAADASVRSASPCRQDGPENVDRKAAPNVGDGGVVVTAAEGQSCCRGGSTAAVADLAGAGGNGDVVGEAAADEASISTGGDAGTSGSKRKPPLLLEPLAGRCWFDDCGKVKGRACGRLCVLVLIPGGSPEKEERRPTSRPTPEDGRGDDDANFDVDRARTENQRGGARCRWWKFSAY